jgi:polar amino acid transport system substrate-binding protein
MRLLFALHRPRLYVALVAAGLAIVGTACSPEDEAEDRTGDVAESEDECAVEDLPLKEPGVLTIGTDSPAYDPWFSKNDPSNGKGFESAVAYAVAEEMGFAESDVKWIKVGFNSLAKPGEKPFDFDINQISFDKKRAEVVDFSDSYYDVNQSVVVNKSTPIASAKSIADLKPYELGAQLGTTSYAFIKNEIEPSKDPSVFPQNAGAVQALKNKQIDGLVVDLPTAFYVTAVQVPNSKVLGMFETKPGGEHFGMVFEKGNSLRACVNKALAKLRSDGTLERLQQKWLAKATGAPTLK